jgi:predicted GH43/DUF377 family glycosyl hydrolase
MPQRRPFEVHRWQRDPRNPVFPPQESFDISACMNPFVLRHGDEYWMYYAGGDREGRRRICLAIAPADDVARWRRLGPILDLGAPDSFDEDWCVLPCLHQFGDTWHLYYTGRADRSGVGLQSFRGIGVATSTDLLTWRKHPANPVLRGDGFARWPTNAGIAGAGSIIDLGDGRVRMHYTLSTGTGNGEDLFTVQAKQSVCAHSTDGITWTDKRILLEPRRDADYENAGVIGLFTWKTPGRYRALYSAIGTRFGMYSICEAVSDDGLTWDRGNPSDNLSLAPTGTGWESAMVEYPCVIREGDHLRLFYCGNCYGHTGIGTATAEALD